MVIVENNADRSQTRILARGNFSLDASGLVLLLLLLGVVTLGLAGFLAWNGYWPVLLIALVQLTLVTLLLIRVWKNAWVFEEICFDQSHVRITHQRHRERSHHCVETAWATIRLEQPEISWYAPKLILRCRKQEVELGAFLTNEEKTSLAKHLSTALSERSAWRNR